MASPQKKEETRTLDLFGGGRKAWKSNWFVASDDRVRGGKSFSVLYVDGSPVVATFTGHLDPTVLSTPAAFASQRTKDTYRCPDLSRYDALIIDVPRSDGKDYTIVLKDAVPGKRPDGREEASVSWEHNFHCPGLEGGGRVMLHFKDFKPFYRGRAAKDVPPLDLSSIKRISIMIRSFFGRQKGSFSLVLLKITAYKYRSEPTVGLESPVRDGHADGRWAVFFRKFGERLRKRKRDLTKTPS